MRIIDIHTHIFPEKIAEKAVASIGHFYEMDSMTHGGKTQDLLNVAKKANIERMMVFSTATKPDQVESINRFILSECQSHPEFIGLGTLHPDYENFCEELLFLKNQGIRGIKLHPDFQKFAIDDKRMLPIYDFLQEQGMFVLTHSGDYRYEFSNPDKVASVAKQFPRMNIIGAHFGGWSEWDKAFTSYQGLDNIYVDTCSVFPFGGTDLMQKALSVFDPTHIFFGSDFPMWDPASEIETILSFKLGDQLTEDIFYNNFASFYGLE